MPDKQTDRGQGDSSTSLSSARDQQVAGGDEAATRTDSRSITSDKRHSPSEHQQPAPSHSRGIFKPSRIALVVILSALLGVVGYFAYNLALFSIPVWSRAHSKKGAQQEQPPNTCATIHTSPPCRFLRKNRITRATLPL